METPERSQLPNGDYSDDSSLSFGYNAPHRFIWEVLINPAANTPVKAERGHYMEARGPVLAFFMEMKDDIGDYAAEDPDPLAESIAAFDDTIAALMSVVDNCNFTNEADAIHDFFYCPASLLELGFDVVVDSVEAFHNLVHGTTELLAGEVLDAYPGVRTVTIIASDNLGNTGTNQCTFEVHATASSLSNNIVRAQTEGKITDPQVFASLKAKLALAQKQHLAGNHVKEYLTIQSFINEVIKIRSKHIDAVFADRLIAWANDLVAVGN